MEPQDTITIAPSVILTTAEHAATQVKGVSGMGTIPPRIDRLFRGQPMANGVVLEIQENEVSVAAYLIVLPDVNVKEVSKEVQRSVKRSIEELVGMDVIRVDVHIEDVNFDQASQS
jgi:uncharacterized alkaline shock family protein YloU